MARKKGSKNIHHRTDEGVKPKHTKMERDAMRVAHSMGCPIVCKGSMTMMTRETFKRTCLAVQRRHKYKSPQTGNTGSGNVCKGCNTGESVRDGVQFKPPKWVTFTTAEVMDLRRSRDIGKELSRVRNMCGGCGAIWYDSFEYNGLCLNCEMEINDTGPSWGDENEVAL